MHASILFLTTFAASALAIPTHGIKRDTPSQWYVTNFNPGCGTSPAGCAYSFDIAYVMHDNIEASFGTHCTGTSASSAFVDCDNIALQSRALRGIDEMTVQVQHFYDVFESHYVATGNITDTDLESAGQYFLVVPDLEVLHK